MRTLAACLALLAGCFVEHHSCPPQAEPAGGPDLPAQTVRDPATAQCEAYGGGGGGVPCDPDCGPCIENTGGAAGIAEAPDWASCYGPCTALDESQCLASTTCHAAYVDNAAGTSSFLGCWDLPPSGAITGSCTGADAQTCSEHPDCTSHYLSATINDVYSSCAAKVMPAACSTLATEADCKARPDCDPIYIGTNCTCDSSGCTCANETYDHCQAH